jgi:hypothetical protein
MIFIRLFGFLCIYLQLFTVYVGFLTVFPPTKLDSATFPWIITLGIQLPYRVGFGSVCTTGVGHGLQNHRGV